MQSTLNKEEIYKLIDESNEHVIGALLRIHSFQTSEEQNQERTVELNDWGFNSSDAGILSDMSSFYTCKGYLSEKQIAFVRHSIKKYWRQLSEAGFGPVAVKPKPQNDNLPQQIVKSAKLIGNKIEVKFNFPKGDSNFFQCVADVKTLSGRRFVSTKKVWEVPLSLESVEKLIEWEFELGSGLQEWHEKMVNKPEATTDIKIPGLKMELYPFQKLGVSFIESRGGRALIGSEMGLGKTCQSLAYLELHPELRPVIIVVPASLKLNWLREINMWMSDQNQNVKILNGRPTPIEIAFIGVPQIIIINYDVLANRTKKVRDEQTGKLKKVEIPGSGWADILKGVKPQVIIGDEIHFIGNPKAARSKAFVRLCKSVKCVIGLSGTPIKNRPIEFYNPIKAIEPTLFPSRWNFAERFCDLRHNGFGWDFNGSSNVEELHKILTGTILHRKLKSEVLKELPDKVHSIVPIELDNRQEYNEASSDIISWIRKNEGAKKAEKAGMAAVLVAFEKLKQLAMAGKMKAAIQWVEDFLESDQKLVIFTTHKKPIEMLMNHFGKLAVKLDGSTPTNKRQEVVDQFQTNDNVRLFIGNVKAAGVGINLFAASNVSFLELPWTPGEAEQASSRVHRIGQKSDSVNVYYLISDGTIEEDIIQLLMKKQKVLNAVLDGKIIDDVNIFEELLKR